MRALKALQHYECALRNLEDADEPAALEALDFAEVFLERAQDDDVRRGLVAEVSLARGALLEVADPSNARLAYDRSFSADGNAAAALRAARLAWRCGDDEAACAALLERARAAGGGRRGIAGDAAELLGRFLAERGRVHEVHELAELGYDRTFSRKALTNALHARPCDDAPARLFDDALPAKALAALRRALRPAARYWRETDYGSPAVGFFSFTHRIDALSDTALEGVLQGDLARRRQSPAGGAERDVRRVVGAHAAARRRPRSTLRQRPRTCRRSAAAAPARVDRDVPRGVGRRAHDHLRPDRGQ